jgi:Alpha/beta hydrolase domain
LDKHPGDLFSYDIFTQAGAAIRGDGKGVDPFQGLKVRRVIAMGESQAAGRMATYVNAVHPRARLYDGILIHSRGATPAPFGARQPDVVDPTIPEGAQIRRDVDVPVLTFETEYDVDVLAFADARQPDSRNFRLWESAGTSHIDAYTAAGHSLSDLGDGAAEAALLDPTNASRGLLGCAEPINAGGQHAVLMAALSHLDRWVRDGTAPPKVPRLKTTGSGETIELVRDELGIARGASARRSSRYPLRPTSATRRIRLGSVASSGTPIHSMPRRSRSGTHKAVPATPRNSTRLPTAP